MTAKGRQPRTPLEVVIVGGGVFGVSTACELSRRGHAVQLVDAGPVPHPAASSTDVSKIVRMDYGDDGFYTDLAREALEGWRVWNRAWETPLYREVGLLLLSRDPFSAGAFEADSFRCLSGRGVPVERLDRDEIAERYPVWARAGYADGYLNPQAGFVTSREVVATLREKAVEAGVELHEHTRCTGLVEHAKRVTGVRLADGRSLGGDCIVVAAGAWTPSLLPDLGDRLVATGQPVVHLEPLDPTPFSAERFPVWCADIANSGRYGFPAMDDGSIKIGHHGDGRRYAPGDPLVVTEAERVAAVEFATTHLEGLVGARVVATRRCLYCDTADGNFLIDHDPARPGLVVAAGGSGHGFKFAPVLGGIVADVIERRPNRYAGRFAWREAVPGRREQSRQRA